MENRNRNVWIIVIVVVIALALVACCVLAVLAVGVGSYFGVGRHTGSISPTVGPIGESGRVGTEFSRNFEVGSAPVLVIDNFAGVINVRAGASGEIRVTGTKKGRTLGDMNQIQVDMQQSGDQVTITTRIPGGLRLSNISVAWEVQVPANTRLDLHSGAGDLQAAGLQSNIKLRTGAGTIQVSDVNGQIDANTGAGAINIHGANGPVQLHTGAGEIIYQGSLTGDSNVDTGTGAIVLTLPATANIHVDLSTGMGAVSTDYDVSGTVQHTEIRGVIGSGADGQLRAHTGIGSVDLNHR